MQKRNLYLNNIPVGEALTRFMDALKPYLTTKTEEIAVTDSLDRVLAQAVFARRNSPLYDSAAMDGIAVISERTRGADESRPLELKRGGDYIVVDTSDPVRLPYDAVIMAEVLHETGDDSVLIRAAAAPWQHVRPVGEDIVQGEMLLPGGHKIRPIDIGVLLSAGITSVAVCERPKVAIFPTGTELIAPDDEPEDGAIIESNSYMLKAMVAKAGGIPSRFPPVPDDYGLIKEKLSDACGQFDMVLVNAGSSAGTEDFTVHVLRELGEVVVHGVAMKPGKPVILSVVNGKPVIGVPGYPVSAYLACENFVLPVIAAMCGSRPESGKTVKATLTRRLVSSLKHREYVRVKVGRVGERLVASPLARGAGAAMSLVRADGFCIVEQDSEGAEAGSEVEVVLHRDLNSLDKTVVSIGSHDLILDIIADMLPNLFNGANLSSAHVGSMGGILALKNGEAHIAPVHLLDENSGTYNEKILTSLLADRPMALIKGVGRTQGIMVRGGNPSGITGVKDLSRCRYINRQRGAGTRVLLDYMLKQAKIEPESISGYDREAATHMAVAAAIAGGSADAGMGILSAVKVMDLDFIPVGNEEYDFAVPAEYLELQHVQAFIKTLKHPDFLKKLDELGGYTYERCGEVILLGR